MTRTRIFSPVVGKEVRALLPSWLACLALFVGAAVIDQRWSRQLSVLVYFLGPVALGAFSLGHEYSGRTLSLLLSQPKRRENLILLKLSVLAAMLLVLSTVGFVLGVRPLNQQALVFVVPLLCGLFIAPWLTMLCRNPLAGIVFTTAISAFVLFTAETAATMKFGVRATLGADAAAFKSAVVWWGMVGTSVVAAVAGWRLFMRLEAIDGRGQAVRLPWLSASTAPTAVPVFEKRHPLWLLTKKELRLQQLSFVVGGLYALAWFAIWSLRNTITYPDVSVAFASVATALPVLALPLLAGSLASAEERQLGTIEWQALLPMPARTQWWMKVGITVGVACLLGIALPVALAFVTGSQEMRHVVTPFLSADKACVVVFLSVMALYVSSVCGSPAQALLWSVAAGFAVMGFVNSWMSWVGFEHLGDPGFDPFETLRRQSWWTDTSGRLFLWLAVASALAVLMYSCTVGLLLRFARANHLSPVRTVQRISRQLLWVAMFLALMTSLWFGASKNVNAEMTAHRSRLRLAIPKRGVLADPQLDRHGRIHTMGAIHTGR